MRNVLITLMLCIFAPAAAQPTSEAKRYEQFENDVRIASIAYREQSDACRVVPAAQALCNARVDAKWRKAMALAKARYVGTKEAWADAQQIISAADARLRQVEAR